MREVFPLLRQRERKAILMAVLLPVFLWFWCAVALHLNKNKSIEVCLHRLPIAQFQVQASAFGRKAFHLESVFFTEPGLTMVESNFYLAVTRQHNMNDIWWTALLRPGSKCWHYKTIISGFRVRKL